MNELKNIIDKIWDAHVISHEDGAPDVFFIDLQLLHEVTSPQAFTIMREKGLPFMCPDRNFATLDHSVPTDEKREAYADAQAKHQVESLRKNCEEFNIPVFDFGSGKQGIVHVIGPEQGLTQPGKTIVCGDSHTSTHGAFGALAFGIGTTQIGHVMATQTLLLEKPKTMKVEFIGTPTEHFTAKDAVLCLIAQIGIQGANGHAMEFCGEYIRNLSMEGRMTICNMSIEAGGRFGMVSPDQQTFNYLKGRPFCTPEVHPEVSEAKAWERKTNQWLKWATDEGAEFDTVITLDLEGKKPFVTWGTNPEQGIEIGANIPALSDFKDEAKAFAAERSLKYNGLKPGAPIKNTPIEYVFMGSCTNSRIEDMREVAKILKDKTINHNVKAFVVPGSEQVRAQCESEGLVGIFTAAGAEVRGSGCSMCIAMNGDAVSAGARCASTSNRNFVGRQGQGSFTHLMSPKMAAIAAITGKITDPEDYFA